MVLLQSKMVPLGTPAPDFKLFGIDGELHDLNRYSGKKILVIIFMCNHCPYVQKIWDDLVALEKTMPESVQFLGINSNANQTYPEDSYEKMQEYALAKGQEFPYLYDETQGTAKNYGAQCTPDFFVYNAQRLLEYRGAFDDLKQAIDSLLEGKKPAEQQTFSIGCSIKWT